jgi:lipoyl(octanoyl) transferase
MQLFKNIEMSVARYLLFRYEKLFIMSIIVEDWGLVSYNSAFEKQLEYVQQRIEGKRPDTLILLEHPPTFTIGLRTDAAQHVLWDEVERTRRGISLIETNRGGDVTYHGPGQLVGYPIIELAQKDLHAYLRNLEDALIKAIAQFGLHLSRREGKTGLWAEHRKVVAIGVAVKRWVTYHGFAINVNNNLTPFTGIIPCGIPIEEGQVSSIEEEVKHKLDLDAVKAIVQSVFLNEFHE